MGVGSASDRQLHSDSLQDCGRHPFVSGSGGDSPGSYDTEETRETEGRRVNNRC